MKLVTRSTARREASEPSKAIRIRGIKAEALNRVDGFA
jgi:hypothetical protein